MKKLADETLPSGFSFEWTDLSYQQSTGANAGLYIFPICVLFVFLVLAAQYGSWTLPFSVILIVPMCLLAATIGVRIMGQDINILTQIGFVVLVGLAAKNAILIVEFARDIEQEGRPQLEAVIEACRLRIRPILMTSFAFILGVLPLVTSSGSGSEMRQAVGVAVFFGMNRRDAVRPGVHADLLHPDPPAVPGLGRDPRQGAGRAYLSRDRSRLNIAIVPDAKRHDVRNRVRDKQDGNCSVTPLVAMRSMMGFATAQPILKCAMDIAPRLELMNWLVGEGLTGLPENDLIRGFCERARGGGLDISRGLVFIDTLHPIFEGRGFRWNDTETNESDAFEYGSTDHGEGRHQLAALGVLPHAGERPRRIADRTSPTSRR